MSVPLTCCDQVIAGPLVPSTVATVGFDHTFLSSAHTCLQAKISEVDAGGNTIPSDDQAQMNLEVINCHGGGEGDASFAVPLRNDGSILPIAQRVLCYEADLSCAAPRRGARQHLPAADVLPSAKAKRP